jgi:hypothetical protein
MRQSNTFLQLAKGSLMSLELLQQVTKYPLEQIACGIRQLHAKPIILAIYCGEKLI